MNGTTSKAKNAKKPKTVNKDARQILNAIRKAACKSRDAIATKLINSVTEGNATALKALLDAVTFSEPPKEPSRLESLKTLTQMEGDPEYTELSEQTADGFPSGREPE